MKGKGKVIFIVSCILNILLIAIVIKNYTKPVIYINPTEVQSILIVDVNSGWAKSILEKEYIKEICTEFNHVDLEPVTYDYWIKHLRDG